MISESDIYVASNTSHGTMKNKFFKIQINSHGDEPLLHSLEESDEDQH